MATTIDPYQQYLEEQRAASLSARPPKPFQISVRGQIQTVLLIRTNKGIRAFYQALIDLKLVAAQVSIEHAVEDASDGNTAKKVEEVARKSMSFEQQANYMGAILYGLTRQHHPDLTLDDCLEAVPGGPAAFGYFAEEMNRAMQAHAATAETDEPPSTEPNPTKAPAKKGGRSNSSKRNSRSRSSNAGSRRKNSGA